MNFDTLSKLTGWLPGAALGALIGAAALALSWESIASEAQCGFRIRTVMCTDLFGTPLQLPGAVVAAGAIGGVLGAIVNVVVAQFRPAAK